MAWLTALKELFVCEMQIAEPTDASPQAAYTAQLVNDLSASLRAALAVSEHKHIWFQTPAAPCPFADNILTSKQWLGAAALTEAIPRHPQHELTATLHLSWISQ